MKPRSASFLERCSATLRRWLRHTWISRVCLDDWRRGWRALWEVPKKQPRPPHPTCRPTLEFMEPRLPPNDPLGLLQWPLFFSGIALVEGNLLTPGGVLAYGWLGKQQFPLGPASTPAGGTDAAGLDALLTDGAPGNSFAPWPSPSAVLQQPGTAAVASVAPGRSSLPASNPAEPLQTADDLFHNPLGDVPLPGTPVTLAA